MMLSPSGVGPTRERGTPVVLRLLPHVHHPPARVLMTDLGGGYETHALDARGYRVTVAGPSPGPGIGSLAAFLDLPADGFDLVCEAGWFATLGGGDRARYVDAAARALRPGGLLFGAFPVEEGGAGPLIAQMAPRFDVARLDPGAAGWLEAVFVRR